MLLGIKVPIKRGSVFPGNGLWKLGRGGWCAQSNHFYHTRTKKLTLYFVLRDFSVMTQEFLLTFQGMIRLDFVIDAACVGQEDPIKGHVPVGFVVIDKSTSFSADNVFYIFFCNLIWMWEKVGELKWNRWPLKSFSYFWTLFKTKKCENPLWPWSFGECTASVFRTQPHPQSLLRHFVVRRGEVPQNWGVTLKYFSCQSNKTQCTVLYLKKFIFELFFFSLIFVLFAFFNDSKAYYKGGSGPTGY